MRAVSGLVSAVTLGLSLIKPEEAYVQDDWEPVHCEFTLTWSHPRAEALIWPPNPVPSDGMLLIDHSLVRKAWLVPPALPPAP